MNKILALLSALVLIGLCDGLSQEILDCMDTYKELKKNDNMSWIACQDLEPAYLACHWDEDCEGKIKHRECTDAYIKEHEPPRAEECNAIRSKLGPFSNERFELGMQLGDIVA